MMRATHFALNIEHATVNPNNIHQLHQNPFLLQLKNGQAETRRRQTNRIHKHFPTLLASVGKRLKAKMQKG